MVMTSKLKPNHSMKTFGRVNTKKKYVKFHRMWRICLVFFLCLLLEAVWKQCPNLWRNSSWLLDHDMTQPSYSPEPPPRDIFLFSKIKRPMKRGKSSRLHQKIYYQNCCKGWKKRWYKLLCPREITLKGNK